jgi:uncharacterized membrane protein YciS (DUF1049 family)
MLSFLITFYLLVMPILLGQWLNAFIKDKKMSVGQRRLSLAVLVIATLGWPIVLPFIYLELLSTAQKATRQMKLAEMQLDLSRS